MLEIHRSVASRTPPPGGLAHNPGTCPDRETNRRPCGPQAGTQSLSHTGQGASWHLLKEDSVAALLSARPPASRTQGAAGRREKGQEKTAQPAEGQ